MDFSQGADGSEIDGHPLFNENFGFVSETFQGGLRACLLEREREREREREKGREGERERERDRERETERERVGDRAAFIRFLVSSLWYKRNYSEV